MLQNFAEPICSLYYLVYRLPRAQGLVDDPLVKPSCMFPERCLVLSCPQHLFMQGAAI